MTFFHIALAAAVGVWGSLAALAILGLTAAALYGDWNRRHHELSGPRPAEDRKEVPHA